jgi:hypothetical protein
MINDTPNIIRPTNRKVFGFISYYQNMYCIIAIFTEICYILDLKSNPDLPLQQFLKMSLIRDIHGYVSIISVKSIAILLEYLFASNFI